MEFCWNFPIFLLGWRKICLHGCLIKLFGNIMHRTKVSGNLDISVYAHTECSENMQSILHVKSFMFNKPEVDIQEILYSERKSNMPIFTQ